MPESHVSSCQAIVYRNYLSDAQLRFFRDRLLRWRQEQCQRLTGRSLAVPSESLPDWIDSASLSTQVALTWADRERSMDLIRHIDAALERIASGTYGYCRESGEEIGIERLMALPTAQYCVETQRDLERRKRRFG